jgi:hypothetical protein
LGRHISTHRPKTPATGRRKLVGLSAAFAVMALLVVGVFSSDAKAQDYHVVLFGVVLLIIPVRMASAP